MWARRYSGRESIFGFLAFVVLVPLLRFLIVQIPLSLGVDAMTSWANGQIAEKLGISSPTLDQVITFLLRWAPAALLAVICVSGWIPRLYRFSTRVPNAAPIGSIPEIQIAQLTPAPAPASVHPPCNEPPFQPTPSSDIGTKHFGACRGATQRTKQEICEG